MDTKAGPGGRGETLDEAKAFVDDLQLTYHHPVPLSTLAFDPEVGEIRIPGDVDRALSSKAVIDLSRMVGLPTRFISEAPNDIAAWNFNRALPNESGDVVFVTDDSTATIVAALRPGSNPLRVHDFLRYTPADFQMTDWTYGEAGFVANYQSDRVQLTVQPRVGDPVQAMVKVMLRDLENKGPGVKGTLLRLVCTNGATAAENNKARSVFQKEAWLEPRARVDTISRSAALAISDLDAVLVGLSELPQLEIELPIGWPARQDYLRDPLKKVRLGRSEVETVASALDEEEGTMFGLYNAITRVGRDALVVGKKAKYESAGFDLILNREKVYAAFTEEALV